MSKRIPPKKTPPSKPPPVDFSAELYRKDYAPAIKHLLKQFAEQQRAAMRDIQKAGRISWALQQELFEELQDGLGGMLRKVDQIESLEELSKLAAIEQTQPTPDPQTAEASR